MPDCTVTATKVTVQAQIYSVLQRTDCVIFFDQLMHRRHFWLAVFVCVDNIAEHEETITTTNLELCKS